MYDKCYNIRTLDTILFLVLLAFIAAVVFFLNSFKEATGVETNVALADSLSEDSRMPRTAFVDLTSALGMSIYKLHFNSIELACGQRPDINDSSVAYCAEAAFTGECLTQFKHFNIAGNHVSGGVYYKGFRCKANTGAFVFYNKKWKFLYGDYYKELRHAGQRGGMAFAQNMIIYNSDVMPLFRKDRPQNIYRALCNLHGNLCVIESQNLMAYSEYVDTLKRLGVIHALYLDMGEGWNYSWCRDATGSVHVIHPHKPNSVYQTNWIVFR